MSHHTEGRQIGALLIPDRNIPSTNGNRTPVDAARSRSTARANPKPDAAARAIFELTPHDWFRLEDKLLEAAVEGRTGLEIQVTRHDGTSQLDVVHVEDLAFLGGATLKTMQRLRFNRQLAAFRGALDKASIDIDALVKRRIRSTREHEDISRMVRAALPPPEHVWCQPASGLAWWPRRLLAAASLPMVTSWLQTTLVGELGAKRLSEIDWLRILAHRVAHDTRHDAVIDALRGVYRNADLGPALIEKDRRFHERFDLRPFGGPWLDSLGIRVPPRRSHAFGQIASSRGAAPPGSTTVVIPSYQHAGYVAEAVRSALDQTCDDTQVLVIDDCSTDGTAEVARQCEHRRLRVIAKDANRGLGDSLSVALRQVDTPYIAMLNSDDLFHPGRIERCSRELELRPDIHVVTTDVVVIDERGEVMSNGDASLVLDGKRPFEWMQWFESAKPERDVPPHAMFHELLRRNFLVSSSNLVARTDWLRERASLLCDLKFCLDWQVFLLAAMEQALHHLHLPMLAYRLHPRNTVWFDQESRGAFYLEMHRVAARSVERQMRLSPCSQTESASTLLESTLCGLSRNRDLDGMGLFLTSLLGAESLESLSATNATIRARLESLQSMAARNLAVRDEARQRRQSESDRQQHLLSLLNGRNTWVGRMAKQAAKLAATLTNKVHDLQERLLRKSQESASRITR